MPLSDLCLNSMPILAMHSRFVIELSDYACHSGQQHPDLRTYCKPLLSRRF